VIDKTKTWRCIDGREVPIAELETGHLCNILGMLKRNAAPHLEVAGFDPNSSADICIIYPHFEALETEMRKRLAIDIGGEEIADAAVRFSLLELK
jgi:hypothetical protein